jgi:hypothetical protein
MRTAVGAGVSITCIVGALSFTPIKNTRIVPINATKVFICIIESLLLSIFWIL